MAQQNETLRSYISSQKRSIYFILELLSQLNSVPKKYLKKPTTHTIEILEGQTITISEAWNIVTEFLIETNAPYSLLSTVTNFNSAKPKQKQEIISRIFTFLSITHEQTLNIQSITTQDPIATADQIPPQTPSSMAKAIQEWKQSIKAYNDRVQQIQQALQFRLSRSIPPNLRHIIDLNQLARELAHRAPDMQNLMDEDGNIDPFQLQLHLTNTLATHYNEALSRFLAIASGNESLIQELSQTMSKTITGFGREEIQQLATQQVEIVLSKPQITRTNIEGVMQKILDSTDISPSEKSQLTDLIMKLATSNAIGTTKDPESLIKQASKQLGIDPDRALQVLSPVTPFIKAYQQKIHEERNNAKTGGFINSVRNAVLKRLTKDFGVDPNTLTTDREKEAREYIRTKLHIDPSNLSTQEVLNILKQHASSTDISEHIQTKELQFVMGLIDQIEQKLKIEQLSTKLSKWNIKALIRINKNLESISNSINRYAKIYNQTLDAYIKIEDTLSLNRPFMFIQDKLQELYDSKYGWIFWPADKLYDAYTNFIMDATNNLIQKTEEGTTKSAKILNWALKRFKLGGYSIDGFVFESVKSVTSKIFLWSLDQASNISNKVAKPIYAGISTISTYIIRVVSSEAFKNIFMMGGLISMTIVPVILFSMNIISDTIEFFKGVIDSMKSPYITDTISGLMDATRKLLASQGGGLIGGGIALAVTSATGIGAVIAFFFGYAIGREIGKFLNYLYEKFIKPYSLAFFSALAVIMSGISAMVIAIVAPTFAIVGISILTIVLLFQSSNFASKIPTELGAGNIETQSRYISVTKSAKSSTPWDSVDTESKTGYLNNTQIPTTITYTITITPKIQDLSNIKIQDKTTVTSANQPSESVIYNETQTIDEIKLGETKTYTYTVKINDPNKFANSRIQNTVTVSTTINDKKEQSTDSTVVIIGNPPLPPIADYAEKLATALRTQCGSDGIINATDLRDESTCINNIRNSSIIETDLFNRGLYRLQVSAQSAYGEILQCVGFVRSVTTALNIPFPQASGDAKDFDRILSSDPNWTKQTTPQAGDIFVWQTGSAGHIGIVVGYQNQIVTVADANADGNGNTSVRNMHISTMMKNKTTFFRYK